MHGGVLDILKQIHNNDSLHAGVKKTFARVCNLCLNNDVHQRKKIKDSVLELSHTCTDVTSIHIELTIDQINHLLLHDI